MNGDLGIGIVGCGNISTTYLRLAPRFRGIAMRACADLNPEIARTRGREFGIRAETVAELLSDPQVDIVLNLTVPAAHSAVSKAALAAGKHVYSEKPLVLSLAEGRTLERLARRKGLRVGCAPDTFLGGAHQQARKAIDDGLIGKAVAGSAHVLSRGMEHWHPDPDFFFKKGGGPVFDMGPYYIANLINLLGPVARVAALTGMARKRRVISSAPRRGQFIKVETPTTVNALLEFASGAQIAFSASWDVCASAHRPMEIYGSEGAMFLPDPNFFGGTVQYAGGDGALRDLPAWEHLLGVANQDTGGGRVANYRAAGLADMAAAIAGNRDQRCSLARSLHSVEVMTAILKAGETGRFVKLSTSCTRPKPLGIDEAAALLR